MYLAQHGNIRVCAAPVRGGLKCGTAHLSSLRPSSRLRNSKILALCTLFFSAESVAPIADTDTDTHGEQEPATSMDSPGITTTFIRWSVRQKGVGWRETHQVCNTDNINSNTFRCREKHRPICTCNFTQQGWRITRNTLFGTATWIWSHSRPPVCLAKLPRRRKASLKSPRGSSRRLS